MNQVSIIGNSIKLTFYGGVNEIGNKVLLEDLVYDAKIFLDFGANIQNLRDYKDTIGDPTSIRDLTAGNFLPDDSSIPINNLYSTHFLLNEGQKFTSKVNECKDKIDPPSNCDGIFISHAHRDHYYGLSLLNRNIPVYAGDLTEKIIKAYSEATFKSFDNFLYGLKWNPFRTHDIIDIKGIKIYPVHVDHSIPAAYGFVINTSAGLVVYSGDFRMHGPLRKMTTDLITKCKEVASNDNQKEFNADNQSKKVIALICEGTFIHKGSIESENLVKNQLEELFKDVVFDYFIVKYQRTDWDRFRTFVKIAKTHKWKYIISEKDAYFYYILNNDKWKTMQSPNILKDDCIYILEQEIESGWLYSWQKKIRRIIKENDIEWRFLKLDDVKGLGSRFFLYYTTLQGSWKRYLPPDMNGAFLSSDIDPYSDENYENDKKLMFKLRDLGLTSYRIHASGHAKPHDIYKFVIEINPQNLYPIHTEYPELFKSLFKKTDINVILPEQNTPIIL